MPIWLAFDCERVRLALQSYYAASGAAPNAAGSTAWALLHTRSMRRIGDQIWVHEHSVFGIDDGLRMTILQLDEGLWVHAPTPLTAAVREAIDALGPVRHLIAPNNHHHKSLQAWHDAYPTAQLHVSPAIPRKQPWLAHTQYELLAATPVSAWESALQSQVIAGTPFFSETVFLHAASRSLIVTDLVQNQSASERQTLGLRATRALFAALGFRGVCTAPPLALPWVRKDAAAFRASLERILTWRFERIVVCHGAIVERDGHEIFRRLCARWL